MLCNAYTFYHFNFRAIENCTVHKQAIFRQKQECTPNESAPSSEIMWRGEGGVRFPEKKSI